jgi:hypothetical protein
MTADQKDKSHSFSTRVLPSIPSLIPLVLVAPSIALVVLPFMDEITAVALGFLVTLAIFSVVVLSAPVVSITSGNEPLLRVGRASIPLRFVGEVEIFSGEQMRFEKGPGLNAKAFFVNQAGTKSLVKVTIIDEGDPTPYWLFACNKPDDLVVALRANR